MQNYFLFFRANYVSKIAELGLPELRKPVQGEERGEKEEGP